MTMQTTHINKLFTVLTSLGFEAETNYGFGGIKATRLPITKRFPYDVIYDITSKCTKNYQPIILLYDDGNLNLKYKVVLKTTENILKEMFPNKKIIVNHVSAEDVKESGCFIEKIIKNVHRLCQMLKEDGKKFDIIVVSESKDQFKCDCFTTQFYKATLLQGLLKEFPDLILTEELDEGMKEHIHFDDLENFPRTTSGRICIDEENPEYVYYVPEQKFSIVDAIRDEIVPCFQQFDLKVRVMPLNYFIVRKVNPLFKFWYAFNENTDVAKLNYKLVKQSTYDDLNAIVPMEDEEDGKTFLYFINNVKRANILLHDYFAHQIFGRIKTVVVPKLDSGALIHKKRCSNDESIETIVACIKQVGNPSLIIVKETNFDHTVMYTVYYE